MMALVSASRINLSFVMVHIQRWVWLAGVWRALSSGETTSRAAAACANHPGAGSARLGVTAGGGIAQFRRSGPRTRPRPRDARANESSCMHLVCRLQRTTTVFASIPIIPPRTGRSLPRQRQRCQLCSASRPRRLRTRRPGPGRRAGHRSGAGPAYPMATPGVRRTSHGCQISNLCHTVIRKHRDSAVAINDQDARISRNGSTGGLRNAR
jgi:hypothetical protein